jgi:hypothetical protein
MCLDPMTMAMVFQAVQSISQGNQQGAMLDYQAQQAEADAQASREQGQVNAEKVRKAGKYQQSEARAALAASGVETGAGTPVKIAQQILANSEKDAQQQLISGNRQAANLQSEANASKIAASNARTDGYMRAGGSLLQGGANIASGWKAGVQQSPSAVVDRSFSYSGSGLRG